MKVVQEQERMRKRTELAVIPVFESLSLEMGWCFGCVVREDAHVASERDGILLVKG